mmetsp:Transcript_32528/g.69254  ORF Transcript_32528/g.69254 Transcript_32528/m.69254 type:complete len:863 (+) Transcript_32528:183-2771(+)|eukprot:CAMPEP_0172536922 /NCGR_PEP_ID=MMETSP1067-20121228/8635_1 /TAXON_ID=265564 ORGANISM="Thalassiosira punctigera, Strain Tpunct2005C2" /NCGR_SAMPLE_ID=MMETSP1067 /ASSEMBLY_ACC=CAM_ASM_000444 /LENGTH=862 /DNA_ID=CAMNT_0013322109 /DNA_START=113 /DNA_END=2701 /DNA_ORIENTATION=-
MAEEKLKPKVWKHIGLYGHAVGTFTADPAAVAWKSAIMGNNVDDVETKRILPKTVIAGALWTVFGRSGHLRVLIKPPKKGENAKMPAAVRFDGFPPGDYDSLAEAFNSMYGVSLKKHSMSAAGNSWGNTDIANKHLVFRQCRLEDADEEGEEFEPQDGDEMMSLDLGEVSQCVLPGNNRNEIEMQFLESDTVEAGTDQLVAVRFYVPPDADADPTDKDAPTSAEVLQGRIMQIASVKKTSGSIIAEFDENKGTFLTPRGRYAIELYDSFLRMRGAKYDYKIKYDDISRLFLLPKQDDMHMAFVIALDKPVRQGQQRYNMLVMQCTKEHSELDINLDDATLKKEYNGDIQAHMNGSFSNLVAKTFKVITKKKVFIPGKFANSNQQTCVKCALRANEGHLYPLEKQFIFIHKPAVLIRFDEIESVEFQRYAGGQGSTRNFDLCVTLQNTPGDNLSVKEYTFSGIDKTNYAALYSFLSGKKIRIKNIEGVGAEEQPSSRSGAPMYDETYGGEEGESSEDEDYDQANPSGGEESGSSDSEDDDELGSVASDDSDLAEHRGSTGIPKKKKAEAEVPDKKIKAKKKSKESAAGEGGKSSSPKKRKELKRKDSTASAKSAASIKSADSSKKKKKKKKDPNAPKRALSAYMYFTSAKRGEVKAANPDASFGDIAKLVSEEWKKLGEGDKAKWNAKAEQDKARYKNEMVDYEPPSDSNGDDSADDDKGKKPKAKRAKKDPNAPKRPMNAYMIYANSVRAQIREEKPDLSMTDVTKEISQRYKSIGDGEKAKLQAKVDAAKEVYKKQMASYEISNPNETPAKKAKLKAKPKAKPKAAGGKKKKKQPEPESSDSEDSDDSDGSDDSDSDSDSD